MDKTIGARGCLNVTAPQAHLFVLGDELLIDDLDRVLLPGGRARGADDLRRRETTHAAERVSTTYRTRAELLSATHSRERALAEQLAPGERAEGHLVVGARAGRTRVGAPAGPGRCIRHTSRNALGSGVTRTGTQAQS